MPKLGGWRCVEDCGWWGSDRPADNRCPRCGAATKKTMAAPVEEAAQRAQDAQREREARDNKPSEDTSFVLDDGAWERAVKASHDQQKAKLRRTYEAFALQLARTVAEKQIAYGDSFRHTRKVLAILYPNGVSVEQYGDLLTITRIIDKLFRVANQKDYGGEDPYQDIAGYATRAACEDVQGVASTPDNNGPTDL